MNRVLRAFGSSGARPGVWPSCGPLLLAMMASIASAQLPGNIQTQLRPFVHIRYPSQAGNTVAQGIFDTGATGLWVTPETNSRAGIPQSPADGNGAFPGAGTAAILRNQFVNGGIVGTYNQFQIGGILGTALDAPDLMTPGGLPTPPPSMPPHANVPAHVYSTTARLANSAPVTRNNIAPSLTYYNRRYSNNIIGTAFVAGDAVGVPNQESPMVGMVDPIHGAAMPFPLARIDAGVGEPFADFGADGIAGTADAGEGNGMLDIGESFVNLINAVGGNVPGSPIVVATAGNIAQHQAAGVLRPDTSLVDNRGSSVAFLAANSARTPTLAHNANPNFLTSLTLTPVNLNGTPQAGGFTRARTAAGGNPVVRTTAPRPRVTLAAGNIFGIAPGNYIADTGAPTTGGGFLGTDNLNQYGQYWDFSPNANNGGNPTLLLFGPQRAADRKLIGPGMLMGVDRNAVGLTHTGVNELRTHGLPPTMNPNNAAFALPPLVPEQAAGLFRTHMSQSNAAYISGVDALDLDGFNGDHMDAVSMGADRIFHARSNTLYFSVDATSLGLAGTGYGYGGGVPGQAALGQQMGDIFQSSTGFPAVVPGINRLRFNQDVMGLGSNVGPTVAAAGRGNPDNLTSLDLDTGYTYGWYGLNTSRTMRNLDPAIITPGDTDNPDGTLTGGNPGRDDVYGVAFDTYFSLDAASTSLGGSSPADIFVNNAPADGAGFHVFAPAAAAGLAFEDDIDALAMRRIGPQVQLTLHSGLAFLPEADQLIGNYAYGGNQGGIDPSLLVPSDLMLFSLTPGSPSLGIFDPILGRVLSAADVFITDFDGTFALFAAAESLGLAFEDNIDGLDSVPEPASLVLLAVAVAALTMRRPRTGGVFGRDSA